MDNQDTGKILFNDFGAGDGVLSYRLRAKNEVGWSAYSNVVTFQKVT